MLRPPPAGIVVEARERQSGALVAVKLLARNTNVFASSASNKPYMLYVGREILHQASLHHPFIIQIYEVRWSWYPRVRGQKVWVAPLRAALVKLCGPASSCWRRVSVVSRYLTSRGFAHQYGVKRGSGLVRWLAASPCCRPALPLPLSRCS